MRRHRFVFLLALVLTATFFVASTHALAGDPTPAPKVYKAGDKVQVEWKGSWYPAAIIEVGKAGNAGKYKIHYDNYDTSWDEWVGPSRIKAK